MLQKDISLLPHDDVYILDDGLVESYLLPRDSAWNRWVDEHISLGRLLFVVPTSAYANDELPKGFEVLERGEVTQQRLDLTVAAFARDLDIDDNVKNQINESLQNMSCALAAAADSHAQVADEEIFGDKVYFATSNRLCIQHAVSTLPQREVCGRWIGLYGMDHLVDVRCIGNDGWEDFV